MPVKVRYQGESKARHIDEILANDCSVHIERLDGASWYLGIEAASGDYHQFWFGTPNGKGKVEFRHQETTPARAALKESEG